MSSFLRSTTILFSFVYTKVVSFWGTLSWKYAVNSMSFASPSCLKLVKTLTHFLSLRASDFPEFPLNLNQIFPFKSFFQLFFLEDSIWNLSNPSPLLQDSWVNSIKGAPQISGISLLFGNTFKHRITSKHFGIFILEFCLDKQKHPRLFHSQSDNSSTSTYSIDNKIAEFM